MSTISKSLSGFIFNGAALALASAPWKSKVRIIYGFNAGGTGYTSFKPSSNFNSLTQLVQDGVYIVDVVTPGFDIPGATLVAGATVGPGVMTLAGFSIQPSPDGPYPEFVVDSSDPKDQQFVARVTNASASFDSGSFRGDMNDPSGVSLAGGYPSGQSVLTVYNSLGNVLTHTFTMP